MKLAKVVLAALAITVVFATSAFAEFMAVQVAEKVKPNVVTIEGVRISYASVSITSRQQRILQSYNTGFIVSKQGHVITAEGTLKDIEAMEVTLADGRKYEAVPIVQDKGYGIGLLKIKNPPADLKPVKFGDPKRVMQGESVVVLGSAGGYGHTLSYGIVSAIRNVRLPSGQIVPGMIQTDVVVNTGNEGSPLFNAAGEVIGMQSVYGGGGSMQNVTFFMPADLVKRVTDELIDTEEPAFRPWIGIMPYAGSRTFEGRIREMSDDLKMYMNLPDEYWDVGMLIYQVWEGSPAYDAGLRYQDFVVKINGELLKSIGQFEELVYNSKEGDLMIFGVIRRDRYQEFEVVVGNHPEDTLQFYI